MATITQEFQSAPMGKRVLVPTLFSFGIIFAAAVFNLGLAIMGMPRRTTSDRVAVVLAPFAAMVVVLPMYLYERAKVSRFRIDDNVLVLGSKRFPLEGAVEVRQDPEVMRWAIKIIANGGLGALRGTFRSKRMGKFYAFMTGTEKAVVVRWPDKTVVVSPADPEFFILSVRSAARIR